MELNREMLEPVIEEVLEVNDLEAEVVLSFLTEKGRRQIQTCPGDIYKIENMLMDYARMLEMAVEQWGLKGFHRATYELHAEQCRKIAQKYSKGIGYDYRSVSCAGFNGYSLSEVEALRRGQQLRNREARKQEVAASTAAVQGIQAVVQGVAREVCGRQDGKAIQENRDAERGRLT